PAGTDRRADAAPVVHVDVDDTTLTYRYEATHDFGYDPVVNAAYIHDTGMPKVLGMSRLLRTAASAQARTYYLTGRPETQRADTERDLAAAGYPGVGSSHPSCATRPPRRRTSAASRPARRSGTRR
ncbi:MAG: HAD family acid phosphatase, partial [Nocardioidaceae bacterium]